MANQVRIRSGGNGSIFTIWKWVFRNERLKAFWTSLDLFRVLHGVWLRILTSQKSMKMALSSLCWKCLTRHFITMPVLDCLRILMPTSLTWAADQVRPCSTLWLTMMRSFARLKSTASRSLQRSKDGFCWRRRTSPRSSVRWSSLRHQSWRSWRYRNPCTWFWDRTTSLLSLMTTIDERAPADFFVVVPTLPWMMTSFLTSSMSLTKRVILSMTTFLNMRPTMMVGLTIRLMPKLPTMKILNMEMLRLMKPLTLSSTMRHLRHTWMLVVASKIWNSQGGSTPLLPLLIKVLYQLPLHLSYLLEKGKALAGENPRGSQKAVARPPTLWSMPGLLKRPWIPAAVPQLCCNACVVELMATKLHSVPSRRSIRDHRHRPPVQRSRTPLKAWQSLNFQLNVAMSFLRTPTDSPELTARCLILVQALSWWEAGHSTAMWITCVNLDTQWTPSRCRAPIAPFILVAIIPQQAIGLPRSRCSSTAPLDLHRRSSSREKLRCW